MSRWITSLLALLVLALTGCVTMLWRANQALSTQLAALRVRVAESERALGVGFQLPEFVGRDLRDEEIRIGGRRETRSLLFIYEPGCPVCETAMPEWIEIHDRLRLAGSEVPITGLSVADTAVTLAHAERHAIPFDVVPFPGQATLESYGVTRVPLTVVVDASGRVEHFWWTPPGRGGIGDVLEIVCPECLGAPP